MTPGFQGLCALALSTFALSAQAQGLTIHELNKELLKHPEAQWSARDNAAAASFKGKTDAFGLPRGYMQRFDLSVTIDAPTPYNAPSSLDWRDKDGVNWVSPIKNQGRCGSCVAFAAMATFEANYNIANHNPALNFDGSEQDLFGRIGSCDFGSWPSSAASTLKSRGAADEACFPYVSGRLGEDQERGTCSDSAARSIKITSSSAVGLSGVKAALQNGPVITSMQVYEDFMYYGGGIYKHVSGSIQGGHAVTIVGYNDSERYWIVKNSWGVDWGEQGFVRVSYDDPSGIGRDNYAVAFASPSSYVKLAAPASYDAVAGEVTLRAEGAANTSFHAVPYTISSKSGARAVIKNGQLDPISLAASFDSTTLEDGVYELKVDAETADGKQSRPWYSLLTVANHPQNIRVTLAPDDFDATKPIKDRVYFLVGSAHQNVPLTHMDIIIAKADGTVVKSITLENPGSQSKFGWRTLMYPNGTYTLTAVGRIGALQSFSSGPLALTVQN